jgi:hypothetical protein
VTLAPAALVAHVDRMARTVRPPQLLCRNGFWGFLMQHQSSLLCAWQDPVAKQLRSRLSLSRPNAGLGVQIVSDVANGRALSRFRCSLIFAHIFNNLRLLHRSNLVAQRAPLLRSGARALEKISDCFFTFMKDYLEKKGVAAVVRRNPNGKEPMGHWQGNRQMYINLYNLLC